MTSHEKSDSSPNVLPTNLPDVIVRDLSAENLSELKEMFEKNNDFFAQGGLIADGLYEMVKKDVDERRTEHRRMGIWKSDALVGFVSVVPVEGADDEAEIAYAVDQSYVMRGIASAAVKAVVDNEINSGKMVIAEVEPHNKESMRLLGKIGFELSKFDEDLGRMIYTSGELSMTEIKRRLGL